MDCGPASLKCLLEGFGISASYGRLREACQTDVDGSSIDTLEEVAGRLGLDAEQTMLPVDHVLLPEARALPALVVTQMPGGLTHFLVVWRRWGPLVQVMDPAVGRRWLNAGRLQRDFFGHTFPLPASAWREWAGSPDFLAPLLRRLTELGAGGESGQRMIAAATADPGWRRLAALDAATRMAAAIVGSGGVPSGREAAALVERLAEQAAASDDSVPRHFWSAAPAPPAPDGEPQVLLQGAVLVRARGRRPGALDESSLGPELLAALREPPINPGRELWGMLRADGLLSPAALAAGVSLAAVGVIAEALLFRAFLNGVPVIWPLLALAGWLLLLEGGVAGLAAAAGRRLEARLRRAVYDKLPHLPDRYFRSRPTSDMAERSHSIHQVRLLPDLAGDLLRYSLQLVLVAAGIAWLDPPSAPLALLAAGLTLALALVAHLPLRERDLRLRSHTGSMARFYLDGLLGLIAIRAHAAERSVRREHEKLMDSWAEAGRSVYRAVVAAEGLQTLAGTGLAIAIVFGARGRVHGVGDLLLLLYWALNLPLLGQAIGLLARQYPIHRNLTLRLLEPLRAPGEEPRTSLEPAPPEHSRPGVRLSLAGASVRAAGRTLLEDLDLEVEAGSQVAIVGPSGAGKSTLAGLLLGWHVTASGNVLVDGEQLDPGRLRELRLETAWVDPDVQLWNRSLLENLRYGAEHQDRLSEVVQAAALPEVVARLPQKLDTRLGEGGGLLSGGEGQRVRFARALLRSGVRLVVLDEPFRGLDRARRRQLLERAREWWQGATLLCITHDVAETLAFERVLVVEGGRIVEDGSPRSLADRPGSRFRSLLEAEEAGGPRLWTERPWRPLWLEAGLLAEKVAPGGGP